MPTEIEREVAAMRWMTTGRLRERYAQVFGEESRSSHKTYLIRKIAWRLRRSGTPQRAALGEKLRPCRPMNRSIHSAATKQRFVGGVHDGVHIQAGDVSADHANAGN